MFAYISTYHVLKWKYLISSPTFPHLNINFSLLFKVLQNRRFSTDRDDTMTRHDFRPLFICVLNLKSLAQFLHTKLTGTKYLTSGENVKIDNYLIVPESTIFNRSRWDLDEARLQTSVYTCIKFESSSSIASDQTRLHKVLGIWKIV